MLLLSIVVVNNYANFTANFNRELTVVEYKFKGGHIRNVIHTRWLRGFKICRHTLFQRSGGEKQINNNWRTAS